MHKIIIHWTGGSYLPNETDKRHYHYLVVYKGGNACLEFGKYNPEDNKNCLDGVYAQHTGGGNTGSVGIAICGMYGYLSPKDVGLFPIKATQVEKCCRLAAEVAHKYDIPIDSCHVMTHYEFGLKNPKTESAGKPDINYLPSHPHLKPAEIGDFIRQKIKWYNSKLFDS